MPILTRLLAGILLMATLVGAVFAWVLWLKDTRAFPLRTIEIRGDLKQLRFSEVEEVVSKQMKQGFFSLNIKKIQNSLQVLPWVAQVVIQRVWPDRLKITLYEQIPQAVWNEKGILDTEAKIFYPSLQSIPEKLPHFNGPEIKAVEMKQQYFHFLEKLTPLGLSISELNVEPDGTWQIRLNNGIKLILGKTALNERLERLMQVYTKNIQDKSHKIAYLDLRYHNGLAIGWKTGALE